MLHNLGRKRASKNSVIKHVVTLGVTPGRHDIRLEGKTSPAAKTLLIPHSLGTVSKATDAVCTALLGRDFSTQGNIRYSWKEG